MEGGSGAPSQRGTSASDAFRCGLVFSSFALLSLYQKIVSLLLGKKETGERGGEGGAKRKGKAKILLG